MTDPIPDPIIALRAAVAHFKCVAVDGAVMASVLRAWLDVVEAHIKVLEL